MYIRNLLKQTPVYGLSLANANLIFILEVEDESTIMARLESELAEILPTEQTSKDIVEENNATTLSKKEKKKKKSSKDSPDKETESDTIGEKGQVYGSF